MKPYNPAEVVQQVARSWGAQNGVLLQCATAGGLGEEQYFATVAEAREAIVVAFADPKVVVLWIGCQRSQEEAMKAYLAGLSGAGRGEPGKFTELYCSVWHYG